MIDHLVERELMLPGGRFRYLAASPPERADAPLMVLLHGFPDHPRSFGPVMARMVEAGYRVVAPWMRGYHPVGAAALAYYRALLWPPAPAVHTLRGGAPARPIAVPVLYLHGASDGCVGCAASERSEDLVPEILPTRLDDSKLDSRLHCAATVRVSVMAGKKTCGPARGESRL